MADDVFTLFDDYAARFARGERPDVREYVRRAGEQGEELAQLLDAFLVRAVPPEPDDDVRAAAEAWVGGEPPLLALRVRRGLRRSEIVDALVTELELDPAKREKVQDYYHQLESGLLDPERVDDRVFAVLARALKTAVRELARWRPETPAPAVAYFRSAEPQVPGMPMAPSPVQAERDEIDRLFTGD